MGALTKIVSDSPRGRATGCHPENCRDAGSPDYLRDTRGATNYEMRTLIPSEFAFFYNLYPTPISLNFMDCREHK